VPSASSGSCARTRPPSRSPPRRARSSCLGRVSMLDVAVRRAATPRPTRRSSCWTGQCMPARARPMVFRGSTPDLRIRGERNGRSAPVRLPGRGAHGLLQVHCEGGTTPPGCFQAWGTARRWPMKRKRSLQRRRRPPLQRRNPRASKLSTRVGQLKSTGNEQSLRMPIKASLCHGAGDELFEQPNILERRSGMALGARHRSRRSCGNSASRGCGCLTGECRRAGLRHPNR